VIRYLIDKAETKCKMAKESVEEEEEGGGGVADVEEEDVVDDLMTHQSILLSTMSLDPSKTQKETAVVLPSLKFLWETYRAVLDILRSNSKLEHLYHSAALGALEFCKVYKRKTEFRRLCDMLRQHLGNLQKYGGGEVDGGGKMNSKVRGWEGWTNESIEFHLTTRFSQLSTASHLHLYTEGFRTVEDIFNIIQISHAPSSRRLRQLAPPKAKVMATYYEKLTTLFWVSENHLFHAFAWYKYYTLCREHNRTMSDETRKLLAATVLISALCIPDTTPREDDTVSKEKMARMATLLGFHTKHPTRSVLLTELKQKGVIDDVPEYLKKLYLLLEQKSDALVLVKSARPLLKQMKMEVNPTANPEEEERYYPLAKYVPPLTNILLLKLLLNLSQAYYTVSLPFLKKLTMSDDGDDSLDLTFQQVEKTIVQLTASPSHSPFSVKIDHRTQSLRFTNTAYWEDASMRSQLTFLSKSLSRLRPLLTPTLATDNRPKLPPRQTIFTEITATLNQEHGAILERKNTIEKRKEEVERLAQEKLQHSLKVKAKEEALRREEEKSRLARESRLREKERSLKIQSELEMREKKKYLKAMGKDVEAMKTEELQKVDTAKLAKEHADKVNKKEDLRKRKMQEKAKKLDYLARAVRIEELPLIKAHFANLIKTDRERYDRDVIEKAANAKKQWEEDCADKKVLASFSVFDELDDFKSQVLERWEEAHDAACVAADKAAEEVAIMEKKERAKKRRDAHLKKMAEDAKRAKEEEERRKEEEERRRKEEEKKKKMEEIEQRRREEAKRMEEERTQKERQREMELQKASAPDMKGKYVPPSRRRLMDGGGGGTSQRFSRAASGRDMGGDREGRFSQRGGGFGGERYVGPRDGPREGSSRFSDQRGGDGDDRRRGMDDRGAGSQRFSDRRRDYGPPEPRNSRWG